MKDLKMFGIGIVTLALGLLVVVVGYNLLALGLGTVTADYFFGGMAVIVLLGGGWLASHNMGFIGKPFMVGAAIALIAIGIRYRTPGVAAYFATAASEANRDALIAAAKLSEGQSFRCDKTTPNVKFFDFSEGKKRKIAWALLINGQFVCYNRPGVNPLTGEERMQIDEVLAKYIREQEPPPTPSPPPVISPIPTPTPTPTPVPVISDGPIPEVTPIPELGGSPMQ